MENKAHALAAGLFIVVVGALLVLLGYWISSDEIPHTTYELTTTENVSGLQPQAAVRYKGVPAGRVLSIGFDRKEPGRVLIRIDVDSNAPISPTTYATLGYQGVTGLAHILLSDADKAFEKVPPGADGLPRIPMQSSPFSQLAEQGPLLLAKVQEAVGRVNHLLSDDNLRVFSDLLARLGTAAHNVDRLALSLNHSVTSGIDPALAQLPTLLGQTRQALQVLRDAGISTAQTATDAGHLVRSLGAPDGVLHDASQGARALTGVAERFGDRTLPQLDRAANETAQAARRLGRVAAGVDDNPQGLIYGPPRVAPGPGEPGFVAPSAAR
ncbi:MAG: mammalian cell entry protein [Comamonas sp. SCN 65-56]|uniref:MlaD family protein n=1 Tax=Comamonas sp. SCN 65-56 TaxID=1660095 RepID=UPI00086B509D|nr:MlaD family protein [Comamonas sp. SCN 65-56]ODS90740.1 MAG: mammalian cell entry protein [Comamonas sp. SCN 65-56]